jgi:hypothetical protein
MASIRKSARLINKAHYAVVGSASSDQVSHARPAAMSAAGAKTRAAEAAISAARRVKAGTVMGIPVAVEAPDAAKSGFCRQRLKSKRKSEKNSHS